MWVAETAARTMAAVAEAHSPMEGGGVLLGYWASDEVVVEAATTPGPSAVHCEQEYEPDPVHDQALISERYRSSGRRMAYLGDWHSHPQGGAYLSNKDLRTLCKIARTEAARAPSPIMIVVAQHDDSFWGLRGWVLGSPPRLWYRFARPDPMEVVIFE